jgi:hypothetical protein
MTATTVDPDVLADAHARMLASIGTAVTVKDEYGVHVYAWSGASEIARDRNPVGLVEVRVCGISRYYYQSPWWWDDRGRAVLAGMRWES